jgi:hypothetical protein
MKISSACEYAACAVVLFTDEEGDQHELSKEGLCIAADEETGQALVIKEPPDLDAEPGTLIAHGLQVEILKGTVQISIEPKAAELVPDIVENSKRAWGGDRYVPVQVFRKTAEGQEPAFRLRSKWRTRITGTGRQEGRRKRRLILIPTERWQRSSSGSQPSLIS